MGEDYERISYDDVRYRSEVSHRDSDDMLSGESEEDEEEEKEEEVISFDQIHHDSTINFEKHIETRSIATKKLKTDID